MPVGFWNDPDGGYRAAYFEKFPNVWRHGDWCEGPSTAASSSTAAPTRCSTPAACASAPRRSTGRSRVDQIVESLVIGQDWEGDVRVVLFVKLKDGPTLDESLSSQIKKRIRDNTTPRHVPAKILQVADIPRTKSGKIVELAVRDVVHGRQVKNIEALGNPEALEHFRNRSELSQQRGQDPFPERGGLPSGEEIFRVRLYAAPAWRALEWRLLRTTQRPATTSRTKPLPPENTSALASASPWRPSRSTCCASSTTRSARMPAAMAPMRRPTACAPPAAASRHSVVPTPGERSVVTMFLWRALTR